MIEEQIKQNAEVWAEEHKMRTDFGYGWPETYDTKQQADAYIAGAHSRDEEIKELEQALAFTEDVVDAQKKELDQLRNPWISVEERLPEKTKGVFSCEVRELEKDKIVFYKDERGYIHTGYLNANNHWRDLDRDNTAIYTVTHWAPIHELKKG